jgi:hypothetical protein
VPALAGGCREGGSAASRRLVDGSEPPAVPKQAEDVAERIVGGRVRVTSAADLSPRARACLRRFAPTRIPPGTPVVERIGVSGETLTFVLPRTGFVYGCDDAAAEVEHHGPWCGGAVGMLFAGRLRDPRVDIANCRTADAEPLGFAWITPLPAARWIAVEEPGYVELYEVEGATPVRVTTSGVRTAESKVGFDYRQLAADGSTIAEERLEAGVAG